ncbi:MAG: response regulator [Candidatus Dadabacteria bacterium]|nr:response regulator [Candidatus Dadabacteria bacterium]
MVIQPNIYYELLTKRLKSEKDISLVGKASDENELFNLVAEHEVDVVFIDSLIPNLDYSKIIDKLDEINPNIGLVVLFHNYDVDLLVNAIHCGIDGCLNINSSYIDLVQSIRTVKDGGIWADNEVLTSALKKFINKNDKTIKSLSNKLTKREYEIADHLYQGFSNKAIAQKLFISEKTVKTHISHIFKKLGIKHRYELNSQLLETFKQFKGIKT